MPFDIFNSLPNPLFIISRNKEDFPLLFRNHAAPDNLWDNIKETIYPYLRESSRQEYDIELEYQKKWFKLRIASTTLENNPIFLITLTEITEYKNGLSKADAISEMKSNFLATMSHEIRTPMQSIYGFLEVMHASTEDKNLLNMIETSKSSAGNLLEILDDILDLAKVDAGKMELDDFEIPLRTLARGLLEGLVIKAKNVKLIDDIAEDIPFVITGDPKRLRQIILNLVGNSLKFTENGSVTLRIHKNVQKITPPQNGFGLRFEIIDTGIGMSLEVASKLFQPFTQADNTTTRVFGGTGLGLSISKKLVELMGGVIGVDSTPGKGSTFWFEIPTTEVTESKTVELPNLDGITVLSVEDHPKGAQEIVNSLRSMGAEVCSTPHYQEAMEWVISKPFDVAIIDYGLSGHETGLDLIKQINKIHPFTGLIMYTVHDDIQIQYDLKTIGATFLAKPASRLGLGQAVKDAAKQINHINFNGPKKLLVVEDTDSVRDVLNRQFKLLNIEADFVDNGKEALNSLESQQYGLCITDLHMPQMDGYQLIQSIREHREANIQSLPVMAITADVQLAHRQSFLSYGFNECLLKPVSIGQLRRLFIRWGLLSENQEENETDDTEHATSCSSLKTEPKELAIDIEAMKHLMGSFDETSIEMLNIFITMSQPLIIKLGQAVETGHHHHSEEISHSLKGAARSACCNKLGDLCAIMQEKVAQGEDPDKDLFKEIEKEFERVCHDIKNLKPFA